MSKQMGTSHIRQHLEHCLAKRNLSAYLDDALAPGMHRLVQRHLEECEVCRQELATLRQTVSLLQSAPRQAVPRSFVLPESLAESQAAVTFWDSAFMTLQRATVVISALLVLLVCADAAFGSALGQGSRVIERAGEQDTFQVASEVPEQPTSYAVEPAMPQPPTSSEEPRAFAGSTAAPTRAATLAEIPPEEGERSATSDLLMAPAPTLGMPSSSTLGLGEAGGGEAPSGCGGGGGAQGGLSGPAPIGTEALSQQGAAPTATASLPEPTEGRVKILSVPEDQVEAPAVVGEAGSPGAQAEGGPAATRPSALWTAWRAVRLTSGILLGLLLVLLGALLWSGYRRRNA